MTSIIGIYFLVSPKHLLNVARSLYSVTMHASNPMQTVSMKFHETRILCELQMKPE